MKMRLSPWKRLKQSLAWKFLPHANLKLRLADGIQLPLTRRGDAIVFNEIILGRLYDECFALIPQVDSFVDLGCNCGFFTASLVHEAQKRNWKLSRGLLVDAEQESAALSAQLLRLNGWDRFIVEQALIGEPGREEIFTSSKKSERSGAKESFEPRFRKKMRTTALADLASQHKLNAFDLLKIDIEGSEKDLLEHESALINSIPYVILEWHAPYCTGEWVRHWLEAHGRKVLKVKTVLGDREISDPWQARVGLVFWTFQPS